MSITDNEHSIDSAEALPMVDKGLDSQENLELVAKMRAAGSSWREIGEHFGVTGQRCHQLWAGMVPPKGANAAEALMATRAAVLEYLDEYGPVSREDVIKKFGITEPQLARMRPPRHLLMVTSGSDRQTYSDEDISDALRDAADDQGEPLTARKYLIWHKDNPSRPSLAGIHLRGDWTTMCQNAGVEHGKTLRKKYTRRHTNDQMFAIVADYVEWCVENGLTATYARYEQEQRKRPDWPSGSSIRVQTGLRWFDIIKKSAEYSSAN
jgi:hypothetical protein